MTADEADSKRLEIAKRIRESREYLNLSQDDVASVLEISRPAVTLIEQGARKVESVELERLTRLFGCSADYLLGSESSPSPQAAFLARSFEGLSSKDLLEVSKFAQFLRTSAGTTKAKPRQKK